jgi:hypothetical protein
MKKPLKYKKAFTVNPSRIVAICRSDMDYTHAMAILRAMGVTDQVMRKDILRGHADVIMEEDGTLSYIDHRETALVMKCLKGDKDER